MSAREPATCKTGSAAQDQCVVICCRDLCESIRLEGSTQENIDKGEGWSLPDKNFRRWCSRDFGHKKRDHSGWHLKDWIFFFFLRWIKSIFDDDPCVQFFLFFFLQTPYLFNVKLFFCCRTQKNNVQHVHGSLMS